MTTTTTTRCPACGADLWEGLYERLGHDFVRCRTCGLVRLQPIPSEEALDAHYASRAQSGNYEAAKAPERDAGLLQVLDFAEAAGAAGSRMFDVGCFDGGLLDLAAERGWTGWGLELQRDAAAEAERKHPGRIARTTLEAYEPPRDVTFDLITAVGLIEHLREPAQLFTKARDILRPGGLLVIQTPNHDSLPARALGRYWPPIAPPEHTFYFGTSTLRVAAARHGFDVIASKPHVKKLRVGYTYEQFRHFGPEFHRALAPVVTRLPQGVLEAQLPLYGGEMLFAARGPW